jgi:hypothetical protein
VVQSELGGGSQGTPNGEENEELNGELNEETTPAAPVANQEEEASPSPLSTNEVEIPMDELQEATPPTLDSLTLDKDEKEWVRRWKMDRKTDEQIYKLVMEERVNAW